jgi:hypothetical protein
LSALVSGLNTGVKRKLANTPEQLKDDATLTVRFPLQTSGRAPWARSAPVATLRLSGSRAWDASHGVEKYALISRQPCSLTISAKGKTGVAEKMT